MSPGEKLIPHLFLADSNPSYCAICGWSKQAGPHSITWRRKWDQR